MLNEFQADFLFELDNFNNQVQVLFELVFLELEFGCDGGHSKKDMQTIKIVSILVGER
jgi:hypothetical protein